MDGGPTLWSPVKWPCSGFHVFIQSLSVFGVPYRLKDTIEMAEGLCEGIKGMKAEEAEKERTKAEVC